MSTIICNTSRILIPRYLVVYAEPITRKITTVFFIAFSAMKVQQSRHCQPTLTVREEKTIKSVKASDQTDANQLSHRQAAVYATRYWVDHLVDDMLLRTRTYSNQVQLLSAMSNASHLRPCSPLAVGRGRSVGLGSIEA